MAKLSLAQGTTSKLVSVFIQDSSVTTGAGLTGLTNASGSLTAYYYREGAGSAIAISLVTMTLGTWTSSGFIVVDGTNMPGVYSIGIPDAALAAGAKSVVILLKGATNMAPCVLEIELTATDNQDAVRMGLTALPNANAEAAGGLYTRGTGAGQINQPANGQIDANTVKVSGASQTARDLGASVLLSPGTGTGQITLTSGAVTVGTNNDKTGYTASTVSDKTGYSLTQTFPTNFSSLAITGGGAVTVGTNSDKTGYSLATPDSAIIHSGTATGGAAGTITLAAGASATSSLYNGLLIRLYGGAGSGQARIITAYNGSTKVATVDNNWITSPDATTLYAVVGIELPKLDSSQAVTSGAAVVTGTVDVGKWLGTAVTAATAGVPDVNVLNYNNHAALTDTNNLPKVDLEDWHATAVGALQAYPSNFSLLAIDGSGDVTVGTNNDKTGYALSAAQSPILESGTAQTGGASTITLRSGASATDDLYRGLMLRIYGGAGAGQARVITGYVGSTKIATVDNAWITNPDVTSTYAIVGQEAPSIDATGSVKIQIPLKRNTAQPVFPFTMRDTLGNLASGLVVSAQVTIDGAALIATTNAPTELGGGWYLVDLAAADLNGTAIGLRFSAAGATVKDIEIFTQP